MKRSRNKMELRTLYYFFMVAREENITRAAKRLHLGQPALSRQLMQLEQTVGKQLLIRGKRKIELTEAGVLLKRRAEEIIDLIEKTEKELISDNDNLTGEIMLGMAECLYTHLFLPDIITKTILIRRSGRAVRKRKYWRVWEIRD